MLHGLCWWRACADQCCKLGIITGTDPTNGTQLGSFSCLFFVLAFIDSVLSLNGLLSA